MKRTMSRGRGLRALFPKRKGTHQHVHGPLVSLFATAAVLLGLLNIAVLLTPSREALATPTSPIYIGAGAGDELSASLTTALDCPYPGSLLSGDLIILQVAARGSQADIASISGFTRLYPASGQDAYLNANQTLWYRFSNGTETGNVSINLTAAANAGACRMYSFRGVVTSSFTEAASVVNLPAGASVTAPTVATTGQGRTAVVFSVLDDQTGMGTFSGETGGDWTEPTAEYFTGIGSNLSIQLQTATMQSGGTISGGTAVFGDGGDDAVGRAFALIGIDTAPSTDNISGWAWSDTGGWLSMNSSNVGAGGGSYGVDMNEATRAVTGWAWSDSSGWVCFGSTCSAATCANGANSPAGSAPTASIDVSGNLHGWAMFCNLGTSDGWMSLNCADTSPSSCGTSSYVPIMSTVSGWFTGFAWHGIGSSGGWGWVDFSGAGVGGRGVRGPYEQDVTTCHDTIDNDADGPLDCADNGCYQQTAYNCPALETQCALLGRSNCCSNGLDDDNDSLIDCSDVADCGAQPECAVETCNNGLDDNANSLIDCADTAACSGFPACTPAWIRTNYSSIYSQQGVGGNAPPAGQNNATYCITSAGSISNFVSQSGCTEASSVPINLPTGGNGYVSNIGRLDIPGITSGRYGTVESITSDSDLDQPLAGKVYVFDRDIGGGGTCPSAGPNGANTAFILSAKTFNNASGSTGRGTGLLVIKGCDLVISGNSSYQASGVSNYLRNLASFGVVVVSKYVSGVPTYGGNIYVNSGVTQIVGLYFGERSIHTGSIGATYPTPSSDARLQVYGALVSRDLKLERRYGDTTNPAEEIIFDGRGVVNPPPGLQDITKSLPALRDAF